MPEFVLVDQKKGKFLFQVLTERAIHYFYINEEEVINLRNIEVQDA